MNFEDFRSQLENQLQTTVKFELQEFLYQPYAFGNGLLGYRINGKCYRLTYDGRERQLRVDSSEPHEKYFGATWSELRTFYEPSSEIRGVAELLANWTTKRKITGHNRRWSGICLSAFWKVSVQLDRDICRWDTAVLSTYFCSQEIFTFRTQCHLKPLWASADFTTLVLFTSCGHTPDSWALPSIPSLAYEILNSMLCYSCNLFLWTAN